MAEIFGLIANVFSVGEFICNLVEFGRNRGFISERILKASENLFAELTDLERLLKSVQDHSNSNPGSSAMWWLDRVLDEYMRELVRLNNPKDRGWFGVLLEWDQREMKLQESVAGVQRMKSTIMVVLITD
ncbi:uncharacterized protein LAJ45_05502 [Morchella importuna]|uniref:uncharacterized protein n=1 Tax=Morchella importuna TaxID=1174673 RepID=UPI001E8CDA8E|nr:uncharacterized protein LAJ45_05502 [Morchella importuna]KAH8150291.1 hypothetical protein LAJ45_05502 [Morchella importuna]